MIPQGGTGAAGHDINALMGGEGGGRRGGGLSAGDDGHSPTA